MDVSGKVKLVPALFGRCAARRQNGNLFLGLRQLAETVGIVHPRGQLGVAVDAVGPVLNRGLLQDAIIRTAFSNRIATGNLSLCPGDSYNQ